MQRDVKTIKVSAKYERQLRFAFVLSLYFIINNVYSNQNQFCYRLLKNY